MAGLNGYPTDLVTCEIQAKTITIYGCWTLEQQKMHTVYMGMQYLIIRPIGLLCCTVLVCV